MKKAFTLVEITVAVGLLALMLVFSSVIFEVGVGSHRTAGANAEIMGKLRAITDQLNADFKGLRKDAPLLIWFRQDQADPSQRYDQIMFFADGDFQSTQLYDGISPGIPPFFPAPTGIPVRGNVARIYYGQANVVAPNGASINYDNNLADKKYKILARRCHILTADPAIFNWFTAFNGIETIYHKYRNNDFYEHDTLSLSEWKTIDRATYDARIIPACFGPPLRPQIDKLDAGTFHILMCDGVGSLAIQWAYWDNVYGGFLWFPSDDPYGDGSHLDSHFVSDPAIANNERFGIYFNIRHSQTVPTLWSPIELAQYKATTGEKFLSGFYPDALKFTFTLYDSRGIIKGGRTFTHIVYLGN